MALSSTSTSKPSPAAAAAAKNWMTSPLLAMTSLSIMMTSLMTSTTMATTTTSATMMMMATTTTTMMTTMMMKPVTGFSLGAHGYGVLLDAGSSSTKVKVYSYARSPGDRSLVPRVPRVRLQVSERVKPGLGTLVGGSRDELRDYLREVLAQASKNVPQPQHASTPLYLMATAGLRILSAQEATQLLGEVREMLGDASLHPFLFHPSHASILSGEEEAAFAWLAVNYLRGVFSTTPEESQQPAVKPVGVMEIGGGSMQVAFLPDSPLYQEEFQVYLGPRRFDLYAQTYLNFGSRYLTTQVRRRLLLHLQQQQQQEAGAAGARVGMVNVQRQLLSPCMLSDDTDVFEWDDVTYRVLGTGNTSWCQQVLAAILQPPNPDPSLGSVLCSPAPCAIGNTYQPRVGKHPFYAISAFQYAPKNLDAVEEGGVLNITKLQHNAQQYCQLTVPQAVAQTGTKARFASNDCMMGLYIPTLLTTAMGFSPDTTTITIASDVNGTRIDWALGAMVQRLSMTFLEDLDSLSLCYSDQQVAKGKSGWVLNQACSGSRPLTSSTVTLTVALTSVVSLVWGWRWSSAQFLLW